MEAHGGYSFCGLASLVMLGKQHLCDLPALLVSASLWHLSAVFFVYKQRWWLFVQLVIKFIDTYYYIMLLLYPCTCGARSHLVSTAFASCVYGA